MFEQKEMDADGHGGDDVAEDNTKDGHERKFKIIQQ